MLKKLIIPIGPPNKNDEFFLAFHAEGKKRLKRIHIMSYQTQSCHCPLLQRQGGSTWIHCTVKFHSVT